MGHKLLTPNHVHPKPIPGTPLGPSQGSPRAAAQGRGWGLGPKEHLGRLGKEDVRNGDSIDSSECSMQDYSMLV